MQYLSLLLPAAIVWNFDPTLFSLGDFEVRWYGLMFAFAFIAGHFVLRYVYKTEGRPAEEMDRVTLAIIIAVVVGARFAHVIFYHPEYYFLDLFEQYSAYQAGEPTVGNPPNTWIQALFLTILRILNIREGGLASHGAAMAILVAIWLFVRKRPGMSFLWLADRLVLTIPLGGAMVRLGNLFNSEICGLPTDLPWAFIYVNGGGSDCSPVPRHPTQIYEALLYIGLFFVLWFTYRKYKTATPQGLLVGLLMVIMFAGRFFIEFFKEWQEEYQHSLPINTGQMLSIPFVLVGAWLIWRSFQLPVPPPPPLPEAPASDKNSPKTQTQTPPQA